MVYLFHGAGIISGFFVAVAQLFSPEPLPKFLFHNDLTLREVHPKGRL